MVPWWCPGPVHFYRFSEIASKKTKNDGTEHVHTLMKWNLIGAIDADNIQHWQHYVENR